MKNLEKVLSRVAWVKNVYVQFADSQMHFTGIQIIQGYTCFRENLTNILERDEALRSLQKYEKIYPRS